MQGLKTVKQLYTITTICFIVIGFVLLIWPQIGLDVICKIVGIFLITHGVLRLAGYFSRDLFQLAFQFDLGLAPVSAGIVAVYVISCLAGGFMAGKIMRKDKCFWGILVGLAYFILLVLVSFAAEGKWDMSFQHLLTTFCMCLGGGALGGMLA